jgi:hypothetical protein
MTIAVVIVAHPHRKALAQALGEQTQAEAIIWDDCNRGAQGNHRQAWRWVTTNTHLYDRVLILEDDAQVTPDFLYQLQLLELALPTDGITSLYLGTGRPPHWQLAIMDALTSLPSPEHCYLESDTLLSAVAYLATVDVFSELLATTDDGPIPIDEQITRYLRCTEQTVRYTVPSLVEHRDETPVITVRHDAARSPSPRTNQPRRAWRLGTRTSWRGPTHPLRSPEELGIQVQWNDTEETTTCP